MATTDSTTQRENYTERRRKKRREQGMKERPKLLIRDGFRCCTKCGAWKPDTAEYFYRSKQHEGGLRPDCKQCNNDKKQSWRINNPEKVLETSRLQRERMTSEEHERRRAYGREYSNARYHADPQAASERYSKYYQENVEYHRGRVRIYRQKHPDKARETERRRLRRANYIAKQHRRRARKQGLPNDFTAADWNSALDYFNHTCAVCGRPQGLWHKLVPDHWIPLASPDCPGTVPTNIVPLCHGAGGCNNIKRHRSALEWLESTFGERKARIIIARITDYFSKVASE